MPGWLFSSLRGYQKSWLRGDVVAGLTVWAVLIPEALAYASIAGVSPVVGLYAAPGALILYAAFGSSRHLVTGPMSATAALSAATVGAYATAGSTSFVAMTAALAITTGVIAVLAGLLRLGFLASFISEPVLKGFIIGLALTIIVGQLPAIFGVEKGSGDFFQKLWDLITKLGDTHVLTLVVGLGSIALLLVLRRVAPAVPGSLAVVLLSILAVAVFNLDDHGLDIVGHIARGLPSLGIPDVRFQGFLEMAGGAAGLMLVGFAEGLGAAKTYAAEHHYDIDVNRELLGLGTANLAAGLSSGMVVNGSLSKTAVNGSAGANSQVSGLVVAAMTILTLLLLTGLFEKLPEATLAAVVIVAVMELVDVGALVRLYRVYSGRLGSVYQVGARPDFYAAIAALLGVTVFDTLPGLFIGIAVSLLLLLYRTSRPRVAELVRSPGADHYADIERIAGGGDRIPGVVILRVEAGLYFANADWVRNQVRAAAQRPGVTAVILDAENIAFMDITAVEMLDQLADTLEEEGVALRVARDIGDVRDVLRRAGSHLDLDHVYPSVRAAVAASRPGPGTSRDTAETVVSRPDR
ncbi:MAG TPA: SulP family inorganic anion transporter [Solirubrobacteraceae bacterium]|nr:SulP family inorganic anion transporter [Solirubrobacteraceae bacterium]